MPTENQQQINSKTGEPEVYKGGAWLTDWASLSAHAAWVSEDVHYNENAFTDQSAKTLLVDDSGHLFRITNNSHLELLRVITADGTVTDTVQPALTAFQIIPLNADGIYNVWRTGDNLTIVERSFGGNATADQRTFDTLGDTDNEAFKDGETVNILYDVEGNGPPSIYQFEQAAADGNYEISGPPAGYLNKVGSTDLLTQVLPADSGDGTGAIANFNQANQGGDDIDLKPHFQNYLIRRHPSSGDVQTFDSGGVTLAADDFDWHWFRRIDANNVEYLGKPFSSGGVVTYDETSIAEYRVAWGGTNGGSNASSSSVYVAPDDTITLEHDGDYTFDVLPYQTTLSQENGTATGGIFYLKTSTGSTIESLTFPWKKRDSNYNNFPYEGGRQTIFRENMTAGTYRLGFTSHGGSGGGNRVSYNGYAHVIVRRASLMTSSPLNITNAGTATAGQTLQANGDGTFSFV